MQIKHLKRSSRAFYLFVLIGLVAVFLLMVSGCATTVGREFPTDSVTQIKIGKTTQDEIRKMFGSPWRVGLEDGKRTWTYGSYKYSMSGEQIAKDLVVRFNDNNVVSSYTFSTTDHNE